MPGFNLPPGVSTSELEDAFRDTDDLAFTRPQKAAPQRQLTAPDFLEAGARTFRQRNTLYSDNYHHFGHIMVGLFPRGLPAELGPQDWNRIALVMNVVAKMQRYAMNIQRGGHADSAHDAMVYAAMLEEMTNEVPL